MGIIHKEIKMGFTDQRFISGTHMCMIYQDEEERRRIIGKFLGAGLASGENVGYFADVMTQQQVRDWLKEFDINVQENDETKNFHINDALSAYCVDGRFDVNVMLKRLKEFYNDSIKRKFSNSRVSGEMSWALRGIPGSERLMEYEARVNLVLQTHPLCAICQYDANKFDGALIMDALRVHPMMIVGEQIVHNPYYLAPEVFLNEFNQREIIREFLNA